MIKKRLRNVRISKVKKLYMPVNYQDHWFLLIIDFERLKVRVYDSYHKVMDEYVRWMAEIVTLYLNTSSYIQNELLREIYLCLTTKLD